MNITVNGLLICLSVTVAVVLIGCIKLLLLD